MKRFTHKNRQELGALADRDGNGPQTQGTLFLCSGDIELIAIPVMCFQKGASDFSVVPAQKTDKLNFCRQGLEPVVSIALTAAQAYVLTTKLPNFRWQFITGG